MINSVDWNKNIIFLVVYITIVVLSVFLYLVPLMDNYKSVIMEYRKTNILDNQINATLDNIKSNEDNILRENIEVFKRLSHKATAKDLQKYAMSFINGVKVKDLGVVDAENGIKIHSFKITGNTRSISNIKNLISNLFTLPNSVRIAFPIILSKNEKRKMLNIEINLMVYNSPRDISKIKIEQPQIIQAPKPKATPTPKPAKTKPTKTKPAKTTTTKPSAKVPSKPNAKSSESNATQATAEQNINFDLNPPLQPMNAVQTREIDIPQNADNSADSADLGAIDSSKQDSNKDLADSNSGEKSADSSQAPQESNDE